MLSKQCPVRTPLGSARGQLQERKNAISTRISRLLDITAAYGILALGLTIAGAAAVVGA